MKVLDDPDRLLRDAQGGDPDCAAIYRVVRRPMYLAVWRCLRPYRSYGGICDDDVVAKAFDELVAGIDGVRSLVGKARVIAYRRAVDVVRKRNLEEPRDCLEDVENEEELAARLERMEELFDRATALLERLSARQRLAVVETVMNHRSCTEVAGELDVSHQAVSKLRNKGLGHLLEWLVEEESAGEEGTG